MVPSEPAPSEVQPAGTEMEALVWVRVVAPRSWKASADQGWDSGERLPIPIMVHLLSAV